MEELYGEELRTQMLRLLKDRKRSSKAVQRFKFTYKKSNDKVCLTIPMELKVDNMPAYMWDNANTTGGDSNEYVHFKIYDNSFKYISANKDINKGVWSSQYKKFVRHSEDEFLAELKRIYFILLELNRGRYSDGKHVINVFFRKILIHLNEHSRYGFNRLYILSKIDNWAYLLDRTKKTELADIKAVLGKGGLLLRERNFQLKDDAVIVQDDDEYNSFLSRLSEDRKRHNIKKFISEGKLNDLRNGYLLPITSNDVKICEKTQSELKQLVNKYNEELTGGIYKGHLNNYNKVMEYVCFCYANYLYNEKMTQSSDTVYISTYIGCPQTKSLFEKSKYFPKVSDVLRETNVSNKDSIRRILTSLKKQNIEQIVADAEALIMIAEGYGFKLNNIETNGKSRLSIVLKEYSHEDLVKELKRNILQSNLFLPMVSTEDAFDDSPIDYNNVSGSRDYYLNNEFDLQGWKFSDASPKVIEKAHTGFDDIFGLVSACADVVKLERKVESYTSEDWIDLDIYS